MLCNLAYREEEREMNPLCADMGVGLIPWSPLGRGRLTRVDGETARSKDDPVSESVYKAVDIGPVVSALSSVASDDRQPRRKCSDD
jgi:aryl-alcohol dehydrogenase-like predicted oxidoreductase